MSRRRCGEVGEHGVRRERALRRRCSSGNPRAPGRARPTRRGRAWISSRRSAPPPCCAPGGSARSAYSSTKETRSPASTYGAISWRTSTASSCSSTFQTNVKISRRAGRCGLLDHPAPELGVEHQQTAASRSRRSPGAARSCGGCGTAGSRCEAHTARPTVILPTAGGTMISSSSPSLTRGANPVPHASPRTPLGGRMSDMWQTDGGDARDSGALPGSAGSSRPRLSPRLPACCSSSSAAGSTPSSSPPAPCLRRRCPCSGWSVIWRGSSTAGTGGCCEGSRT